MNFVNKYFNNLVELDEIDDYIDKWYEDLNNKEDLHTYLGFTCKEYNKWVNDPDFILKFLKLNRIERKIKK